MLAYHQQAAGTWSAAQLLHVEDTTPEVCEAAHVPKHTARRAKRRLRRRPSAPFPHPCHTVRQSVLLGQAHIRLSLLYMTLPTSLQVLHTQP
jgi:predicted aconitase